MLIRKYEMPWRRAYESYASVAWLVALIAFVIIAVRSLSPNPFDAGDTRAIMNFEKIERGGHVLYMCLDSLPDPSVASAIGALSLADLAARAGMRYNLGGYRRMSLFVDEVSNVINQPLI